MRSKSFEALLLRIRGEYTEMPGLRLTPDQGSRLWGLDHDQCDELLHVLVDRGFLVLVADRTYGRSAEAGPKSHDHMAKAALRAQPKAAPARQRPSGR